MVPGARGERRLNWNTPQATTDMIEFFMLIPDFRRFRGHPHEGQKQGTLLARLDDPLGFSSMHRTRRACATGGTTRLQRYHVHLAPFQQAECTRCAAGGMTWRRDAAAAARVVVAPPWCLGAHVVSGRPARLRPLSRTCAGHLSPHEGEGGGQVEVEVAAEAAASRSGQLHPARAPKGRLQVTRAGSTTPARRTARTRHRYEPLVGGAPPALESQLERTDKVPCARGRCW